MHETVYKKEELSQGHGIAFIKDIVVNGFHVEDREFEKFLKDYLSELKLDDGEIVYRASGKLKKKYGI